MAPLVTRDPRGAQALARRASTLGEGPVGRCPASHGRRASTPEAPRGPCPGRRRRGAVTTTLFTKEERMLNAPTLEQLHTLKLGAMAAAWTEHQQQADMTALAFDERFALLVEAEWRARENKRL